MALTRDNLNGVATYFAYNIKQTTYEAVIEIGNHTNAMGANDLLSTTTIAWAGKDTSYAYCGCTMQYVRLYVNYAPNSQDQMLSLALMNPSSKKVLLYCSKIKLNLGNLY